MSFERKKLFELLEKEIRLFEAKLMEKLFHLAKLYFKKCADNFPSYDEAVGAITDLPKPSSNTKLCKGSQLPSEVEYKIDMETNGKMQPKTEDQKKSFKYFSLAADSGHPGACFFLAEQYAHGCPILNLGKDENQAIKYYQVAAEAHHPGAQFRMVLRYQQRLSYSSWKGREAEKKELSDKALRYCLSDAETRHPAAINQLGSYYFYGNLLSKNLRNAEILFRYAAKLGEGKAKANLKVCRQMMGKS